MADASKRRWQFGIRQMLAALSWWSVAAVAMTTAANYSDRNFFQYLACAAVGLSALAGGVASFAGCGIKAFIITLALQASLCLPIALLPFFVTPGRQPVPPSARIAFLATSCLLTTLQFLAIFKFVYPGNGVRLSTAKPKEEGRRGRIWRCQVKGAGIGAACGLLICHVAIPAKPMVATCISLGILIGVAVGTMIALFKP